MLTEARAKQVLERAVRAARATKADAYISLSSTRAGNSRFAQSEITSSGDVTRQQLRVNLLFGKRAATATTNQFDDRSIADAVARAARMAGLAPENPEAMPPLARQTYRAARGAVDPGTDKLSPELRAVAAKAVIGAGDAAKVHIAGFYEHSSRAFALANSAGLWAYHAWTATDLTTTARTSDGTGSGWAGAASHRAADLDPGALAKTAIDKGVRSAKPTRLDPGRYTVVLEPEAVAGLLGFLTNQLGARRADEGRSFFAKPGGGTKVGDKLFPETITLRSDPTDARLRAMPFDREGLPQRPTTWIDRGTLRGLTYDRYWASKQGKPATGQPDGWTLDGGNATREDLIKGVKRGVLITRFWYTRFLDPQSILITGLTRDGVFLIENGAITRPVNNFRFNESPVHMLTRCDALGASVVVAEGNRRVPPLRTHEFNLASISEAV
jgi:predicted Zn-dependent protease